MLSFHFALSAHVSAQSPHLIGFLHKMTMPINSAASEPVTSTEEAPKQSTSKLELSAKTVKLFDADAYRAIVWILVAAFALVVWFSAPEKSDPDAGSARMISAEVNKRSNDSNAQGAPQQQVVNGWFVADALPVISDQIAGVHTSIAANRVPALAMVFGLGFCIDVVGRSFGNIHNRRVLGNPTSADKLDS